MKILITGANGYLGQGIVKSILNHGHKVIVADLSTDFTISLRRAAILTIRRERGYSIYCMPVPALFMDQTRRCPTL